MAITESTSKVQGDRKLPAREVRLLHASDTHLGLAATPTANERAFVALIDYATSNDVHVLVLAGDVFDSSRVGLKILEWTAAELNRLDCPVVILPGNHDIHGDVSAFATFDFELHCPNVHVLDEPGGESVHLPSLDVTFFGRAVYDHQSSFRPLADIPPRPDTGWCVVIGHGLVLGDDGPTDRGSPIFPSDLNVIDWDYVALGHVSTYEQIQLEPAPVFYSGNLASSRDGIPGAVLVEMVPLRGVYPTWIPLGT